jgi:hypothetical protein
MKQIEPEPHGRPRRDEEEVCGLYLYLKHGGYEWWTSDVLTLRERTTLRGMLHMWPQYERRRPFTGGWPGPERRQGWLVTQEPHR